MYIFEEQRCEELDLTHKNTLVSVRYKYFIREQIYEKVLNIYPWRSFKNGDDISWCPQNVNFNEYKTPFI